MDSQTNDNKIEDLAFEFDRNSFVSSTPKPIAEGSTTFTKSSCHMLEFENSNNFRNNQVTVPNPFTSTKESMTGASIPSSKSAYTFRSPVQYSIGLDDDNKLEDHTFDAETKSPIMENDVKVDNDTSFSRNNNTFTLHGSADFKTQNEAFSLTCKRVESSGGFLRKDLSCDGDLSVIEDNNSTLRGNKKANFFPRIHINMSENSNSDDSNPSPLLKERVSLSNTSADGDNYVTSCSTSNAYESLRSDWSNCANMCQSQKEANNEDSFTTQSKISNSCTYNTFLLDSEKFNSVAASRVIFDNKYPEMVNTGLSEESQSSEFVEKDGRPSICNQFLCAEPSSSVNEKCNFSSMFSGFRTTNKQNSDKSILHDIGSEENIFFETIPNTADVEISKTDSIEIFDGKSFEVNSIKESGASKFSESVDNYFLVNNQSLYANPPSPDFENVSRSSTASVFQTIKEKRSGNSKIQDIRGEEDTFIESAHRNHIEIAQKTIIELPKAVSIKQLEISPVSESISNDLLINDHFHWRRSMSCINENSNHSAKISGFENEKNSRNSGINDISYEQGIVIKNILNSDIGTALTFGSKSSETISMEHLKESQAFESDSEDLSVNNQFLSTNSIPVVNESFNGSTAISKFENDKNFVNLKTQDIGCEKGILIEINSKNEVETAETLSNTSFKTIQMTSSEKSFPESIEDELLVNNQPLYDIPDPPPSVNESVNRSTVISEFKDETNSEMQNISYEKSRVIESIPNSDTKTPATFENKSSEFTSVELLRNSEVSESASKDLSEEKRVLYPNLASSFNNNCTTEISDFGNAKNPINSEIQDISNQKDIFIKSTANTRVEVLPRTADDIFGSLEEDFNNQEMERSKIFLLNPDKQPIVEILNKEPMLDTDINCRNKHYQESNISRLSCKPVGNMNVCHSHILQSKNCITKDESSNTSLVYCLHCQNPFPEFVESNVTESRLKEEPNAIENYPVKSSISITTMFDLFEVDNILAKSILQALSSKFIKSGVTQGEMLDYLKKNSYHGITAKLKHDIKFFFDAAVNIGIIERKSEKYFLNECNVGNELDAEKNKRIARKRKIENTDFEKELPKISKKAKFTTTLEEPRKKGKILKEKTSLKPSHNMTLRSKTSLRHIPPLKK